MATNYTGDSTATQAPGSQPGPGVLPISSLPDDGDDLDVASVNQAFKESADFIANLQLTRHRDFWVEDQFCGASLDASLWVSTATGTGTTISIVDDSAADGLGTLSLALGTSGTREATIATESLAVGTKDFYVAARVRMATTGMFFCVGIGNPNTTDAGLVFKLDVGAGEWDCGINSTATINTSSGVAPSTTYQLLEIKLFGGNAYWYIDGVEVHTQAFSTDIADASVFASATQNTNLTMLVDSLVACIQVPA